VCVLAVTASCGPGPTQPDAYCGIGSASTTGLVATAGTTALAFANLSASPNNDCPDPATPGVVSMTIESPDGADPLLTLCIPHPERLPGGLALGSAAQLVDLDGTAAGCSFAIDASVAPAGTVSATGLCDAGSAHAGFALVAAGTVSLTRTCGATVDRVSATLAGTIAIAGP
jgi:hypothetical protein